MRLAIVVLLTAVVVARAGITSGWLTAPVSVDGVPGEWSKRRAARAWSSSRRIQ